MCTACQILFGLSQVKVYKVAVQVSCMVEKGNIQVYGGEV
jgi:hypothetical protein